MVAGGGEVYPTRPEPSPLFASWLGGRELYLTGEMESQGTLINKPEMPLHPVNYQHYLLVHGQSTSIE